MDDNIKGVTDQIIALVTEYGLSVLGAVVILIVGVMVANWAQKGVIRALSKVKKVDETLSRFFASLARYTVLIFTAVAVLSQFGIQTASLIAVLGAAGLAIGLALQGTLSNLAAGVMLLIFRPFRVGNFIEAGGISGTVDELSLFVTTLHTGDNVHIIVPNGQLWGSAIRNFSHHATRRVELTVGIGYDDDIDSAMAVLNELIAADSRVLRDPAPLVAVSELGDSAVNLLVRVWCASGDFWALKWDLTKAIKQRFDRDGISFPYPQHDVHLIGSDGQ